MQLQKLQHHEQQLQQRDLRRALGEEVGEEEEEEQKVEPAPVVRGPDGANIIANAHDVAENPEFLQ